MTQSKKDKASYQEIIQNALDDLTFAYQVFAPKDKELLEEFKKEAEEITEQELKNEFQGDRDEQQLAKLHMQTDYLRALVDILDEQNAKGILSPQDIRDIQAEFNAIQNDFPVINRYAVFLQMLLLLERYPFIELKALNKIMLEKHLQEQVNLEEVKSDYRQASAMKHLRGAAELDAFITVKGDNREYDDVVRRRVAEAHVLVLGALADQGPRTQPTSCAARSPWVTVTRRSGCSPCSRGASTL